MLIEGNTREHVQVMIDEVGDKQELYYFFFDGGNGHKKVKIFPNDSVDEVDHKVRKAIAIYNESLNEVVE